MAILTKTWNFTTDLEGFVLTNMTRLSSGELQNIALGRNTKVDGFATLSGVTYASIGVEAGSTVNSVILRVMGRCAQYNVVDYVRWDAYFDGGAAIPLTDYTGVTSYVLTSSSSIPLTGKTEQSTFTILTDAYCDNANNASAASEILWDYIQLEVDYTPPQSLAKIITAQSRASSTFSRRNSFYKTILENLSLSSNKRRAVNSIKIGYSYSVSSFKRTITSIKLSGAKALRNIKREIRRSISKNINFSSTFVKLKSYGKEIIASFGVYSSFIRRTLSTKLEIIRSTTTNRRNIFSAKSKTFFVRANRKAELTKTITKSLNIISSILKYKTIRKQIFSSYTVTSTFEKKSLSTKKANVSSLKTFNRNIFSTKLKTAFVRSNRRINLTKTVSSNASILSTINRATLFFKTIITALSFTSLITRFSQFTSCFVLQRRQGLAGEFENVASIPLDTKEFEDFSPLIPGETYCYRVKKVLGYVESPWSNIECVVFVGSTEEYIKGLAVYVGISKGTGKAVMKINFAELTAGVNKVSFVNKIKNSYLDISDSLSRTSSFKRVLQTIVIAQELFSRRITKVVSSGLHIYKDLKRRMLLTKQKIVDTSVLRNSNLFKRITENISVNRSLIKRAVRSIQQNIIVDKTFSKSIGKRLNATTTFIVNIARNIYKYQLLSIGIISTMQKFKNVLKSIQTGAKTAASFIKDYISGGEEFFKELQVSFRTSVSMKRDLTFQKILQVRIDLVQNIRRAIVSYKNANFNVASSYRKAISRTKTAAIDVTSPFVRRISSYKQKIVEARSSFARSLGKYVISYTNFNSKTIKRVGKTSSKVFFVNSTFKRAVFSVKTVIVHSYFIFRRAITTSKQNIYFVRGKIVKTAQKTQSTSFFITSSLLFTILKRISSEVNLNSVFKRAILSIKKAYLATINTISRAMNKMSTVTTKVYRYILFNVTIATRILYIKTIAGWMQVRDMYSKHSAVWLQSDFYKKIQGIWKN